MYLKESGSCHRTDDANSLSVPFMSSSCSLKYERLSFAVILYSTNMTARVPSNSTIQLFVSLIEMLRCYLIDLSHNATLTAVGLTLFLGRVF